MSFTTDNNNENAIKDAEMPKSPGRLLAEERAERIRYAQEYRRKLEAEQSALPTKKTKAAEQKEKEKIEKAEKEKAERLLRVEEENKAAELRISEVEEKVKNISESVPESSVEDQTDAEAAPEVDANKAQEPIIVHITPPTAKVQANVAAAPGANEEAKPKAAPGVATINVTDRFKREGNVKPILTYGRVVTEGGWEHEIDDVIRPAVKTRVVRKAPAAPAVVPVAIAGAAVAAAPVAAAVSPVLMAQAPVAVPAPAAEAPAKVGEPAYMPETAAPVMEEQKKPDHAPDAVSNTAAPAPQSATANAGVSEAPAYGIDDPNLVRYVPIKGNNDEFAAREALMEPNGLDGLDFDERYDQFQIEDAHIRYLNQTKKLDKMRSKSSFGKRYNIGDGETIVDKSMIKTISKKCAELVSKRMEFDMKSSANNLQLELLQFSDDVKFDKKENKIARTKILKMQKAIKKAKKLEKKATKRYYSVLAKEAEKPTSLRKIRKQDRLVAVIATLQSLLKEREAIDAKLLNIYKESESKTGGKVRLDAEKKRFKKAKKIRHKLNSTYRKLESYDIPDSLRAKVLHLLNTKIVSESTIAYNKYMIRKLRPKGDAKRALKRNIKRAKYSLKSVDYNLDRMMRKSRRYARVRRRRPFIFILLLILVLGVCCFLFKDQLASLFALA